MKLDAKVEEKVEKAQEVSLLDFSDSSHVLVYKGYLIKMKSTQEEFSPQSKTNASHLWSKDRLGACHTQHSMFPSHHLMTPPFRGRKDIPGL